MLFRSRPRTVVTLTGVGLGGCRVPLPLLAHGSRLLPSWGKGSKWGKATVGFHFLSCREVHRVTADGEAGGQPRPGSSGAVSPGADVRAPQGAVLAVYLDPLDPQLLQRP